MPLNQPYDPSTSLHHTQSPYTDKFRTIHRSSAALADKFRTMNLNVQDPHYSAGKGYTIFVLKGVKCLIKSDYVLFFSFLFIFSSLKSQTTEGVRVKFTSFVS